MKIHCDLRMASDHPCLAGHFPGRPLVPAVVILQQAVAELARALPGRRVVGIPQAKFLSPLEPGEAAQLSLEWTDGGAIKFACCAGERRIATGTFEVEAVGAEQ